MGQESMHEGCDLLLQEARQRADKLEVERAEFARRLNALMGVGLTCPLRAVKELLDKLTELYQPAEGKAHGLSVGRDGRLQLSVCDGDDHLPLSFEGVADLGKGAEQLLEDVRRMVGVYRQASELSEGPLRDKLKEPCDDFQAQLKRFEAGKGSYPTSAPIVRPAREHFEAEQTAADEAEREAVLKGISYVIRQRQPFGCSVRLGLAERFLNWYAKHTKLYIRGQRGKDWDEQRRLDAELALALGPFLRQLVDEEVGLRLAEQHLGVGRIEQALKAWQRRLQVSPGHKTLDGGGLLGMQVKRLRESEKGSADWLLADLIEAIGETASLRGAERVLDEAALERQTCAVTQLLEQLAEDEEEQASEHRKGSTGGAKLAGRLAEERALALLRAADEGDAIRRALSGAARGEG